jgi:CubicO group peptidase (beta-lactamase class C family)
MRPLLHSAATLCTLVLSATALRAQSRSALPRLSTNAAAAIDTLFTRYAHSGSPGCAVGVYQNGAVAFARGYGFANLTHDVPITPETRFTVGSVSKQFTAASIALLVRAGKLSLDDDVRKYVPELRAYDTPVRIRHLVHHTSGMRDFWELAEIAGMRLDDGYTVNDMFAFAARQQRLNFTPGAEYRYSNTGYLALGVVVQRVTGQSLRRFADSAMFAPLGMRESLFLDDHNEIIGGRAMAYEPRGDGWRINVWNNDLVGQGGVVTTLSDLQRWDENFYSGAVGGQPFIDLLLSTEPFNNGSPNSYAFGNTVESYRGLRLVQHTGSTGGYRAALYRFPDQHTSFAMLCNASTVNTGAMALRMADVVLRDALGPVASAAPRAAGEQRALAQATTARPAERSVIVGRYTSAELNDAVFEVAVTADGGPIVLRRPRSQPIVLVANAAAREYQAGSNLVLHFDAPVRGTAPGFTLDGGRVQGIRFVRMP